MIRTSYSQPGNSRNVLAYELEGFLPIPQIRDFCDDDELATRLQNSEDFSISKEMCPKPQSVSLESLACNSVNPLTSNRSTKHDAD